MRAPVISAVSASVTLFVAVSCIGQDAVTLPGSRMPIFLDVSADRAKSTVAGAVLPESYTIYVSSYFTGDSATETDGDHFVSMPFRLNAGKWAPEPAVYWPLGGSLDFLAVACEDDAFDIGRTAVWHEGNCSEGVELSVRDGEGLDSEILFAAAYGRRAGNGSVPLRFRHAQSWLQFVINTDADILRIDSIVIENVYAGGLFRVSNGVYMDAGWSFRGHRRTDVTVPGSGNLIPVAGQPSVCNILVPEQDACDIAVHYSTRISPSAPWSTARSSVFRHRAGVNPWFYGERNVFRIDFSSSEIILEAAVQDWVELSEDITVDENM